MWFFKNYLKKKREQVDKIYVCIAGVFNKSTSKRTACFEPPVPNTWFLEKRGFYKGFLEKQGSLEGFSNDAKVF